MSEMTNLHKSAMNMLLETSRTFFIPISRLTPGLQEAVASAYLCMRSIDEIEDHPELPAAIKVSLLHSISQRLQLTPINETNEFDKIFLPYQSSLPEVTLRLEDWLKLSPATILPNIRKWTGVMAEGMAKWIEKEWHIESEEDLDDYTYYVAGLVGLLLSEIWVWHDETKSDPGLAVSFGRGLQAVNIIRNREEDLSRGVDFFPNGWGMDRMFAYARRNLELANRYCEDLHTVPIVMFCKIPLALAHGTLDALESGESKLSRSDVKEIVSQVAGE